ERGGVARMRSWRPGPATVGRRPIREGIGSGPGPAPPAPLGRFGRGVVEGLIGAGTVVRVGPRGRAVLGGGQFIRVLRVVPVLPGIARLQGLLIQVSGPGLVALRGLAAVA